MKSQKNKSGQVSKKTKGDAADKASAAAQTKKAGTIPTPLDTPEFTAAWSEWRRFSAERGIELSADDAHRQLALLAKMGPEQAIADIRTTMASHPLKDRVAEQPKSSGPRAAKAGAERKATGNQPRKAPPKAGAKAGAKDQKMSALDAAAKVLAEKGEPMNCKEMIETMAAKGYWQSPGGKTPSATLYSAILRELKVKGKEARFHKVARGKFALRPA